MHPHFLYQEKQYSALDEEEAGSIEQSSTLPAPPRYLLILFSGIAGLILLAASFLVGRYSAQLPQLAILGGSILSPLGTVPVTFVFNESFSGPLSTSSDAAWESIFPPTNYFFDNATLDGRRGAFAVFHQLHCLSIARLKTCFPPTSLQQQIRAGYYLAFTDEKGAMHNKSDPATEGSSEHVVHCIEYLRLSIMCHADANAEPVLPDIGGAIGFGAVHQCRSYEDVWAWVNENVSKESV